MRVRLLLSWLSGLCWLWLLLSPFAARAATSIAAITDDPDAFDGSHVTVVGVVAAPQVSWRGESAYDLDGDGRRITVVSRDVAPALGTRLQVEGDVVVHPEGSSEIEWPPVVVETSRGPAP